MFHRRSNWPHQSSGATWGWAQVLLPGQGIWQSSGHCSSHADCASYPRRLLGLICGQWLSITSRHATHSGHLRQLGATGHCDHVATGSAQLAAGNVATLQCNLFHSFEIIRKLQTRSYSQIPRARVLPFIIYGIRLPLRSIGVLSVRLFMLTSVPLWPSPSPATLPHCLPLALLQLKS